MVLREVEWALVIELVDIKGHISWGFQAFADFLERLAQAGEK